MASFRTISNDLFSCIFCGSISRPASQSVRFEAEIVYGMITNNPVAVKRAMKTWYDVLGDY